LNIALVKNGNAGRMKSSGMLRRVHLVRIDVSEERIASIIRVTRIGELGTTLALSSKRNNLRRNYTVLVLRLLVTATFFLTRRILSSDDGGGKFFRSISSYMSHTV
jgi:hypothetical protein